MKTDPNRKRITAVALTKQVVATVLLAASTALSGWGVGIAQADIMQPHQWCPGNPQQMPYIVNPLVDWDWNICHTWYPTNYGMGNVTMQGRPAAIWDGPNPPIEAITTRQCPPISFMCP